MTLFNIDPAKTEAEPRIALFDLGFRPFFLLAGIFSVLLVLLWIYLYATGQASVGYYSSMLWHGHEMMFGYTVAVIAGFLLTAVRNWTGLQTPDGYPLAGLAALWLAGRIAPLFAAILPHWTIALIDLAFLPVLAVVVALPVLRKRQAHNLVFLLVLTLLTIANLLVHSQLLGYTSATASKGLSLAMYVIVFLIAILGGRVIPFFTDAALPGSTARTWKGVEIVSLGSLLLLMLLVLASAPALAMILIALLAAVAHGARLFGWFNKRALTVPLLWVLHFGYAWLVVGFILTALAAADRVNPMLALHAFTTGGVGIITLGMMARVALGHTGRELRIRPAITVAFVLLNLAAVVRVLCPIIVPQYYNECVQLAGLLWIAAFAMFVFYYASVLIRPRIDGRPG